MRAGLIAVLVVLLVGGVATSSPLEQPHEPINKDIPPEYQHAFAFLEFIKWNVKPSEAFEASRAPHWNVEQLMSFLTASRLVLTDVNQDEGKERTFSPRDIQKSLVRRRGVPFKAFAHLAHIYSKPYPQYSKLTFTPKGHGVILDVADWYKLTFSREGGTLKLVRLDYMVEEGD